MIESVVEKKEKAPTSIPLEINVHLKRFGKESWEVDYDLFGYCDMCNSRIDEFGYCACGGQRISNESVCISLYVIGINRDLFEGWVQLEGQIRVDEVIADLIVIQNILGNYKLVLSMYDILLASFKLNSRSRSIFRNIL